MTALHYIQVRRARGLAMPLPPKPKRPLGPPVLCHWRDVPIRMWADVDKGGTRDEFLGEMAEAEADCLASSHRGHLAEGWRIIAALTANGDQSPRRDFMRRVREACGRLNERRSQDQDPDPLAAAIELSKALQRKRKQSLLGRLFRRSA